MTKRARDRAVAMVVVGRVAGHRIGLEAPVVARLVDLEVPARERQAERRRGLDEAVPNVFGRLEHPHAGEAAAAPIVDGVGVRALRHDPISDDVDADIVAGNAALQVHRSGCGIEVLQVRLRDHHRIGTHAAHGLGNGRTVPREGAQCLAIRRGDAFGDAPAQAAQHGLVQRLGAVVQPARGAIRHLAGNGVQPGPHACQQALPAPGDLRRRAGREIDQAAIVGVVRRQLDLLPVIQQPCRRVCRQVEAPCTRHGDAQVDAQRLGPGGKRLLHERGEGIVDVDTDGHRSHAASWR